MSTPRIVPVETNVRVSATAPLQHMCPFIQEVDNGAATILWDTDGWTFELHSLRDYLNTFSEREISHEDITAELRDELGSHPGIKNVTVETKWRTAGMEVTCSSWLIPAGRL